MNTARDVMLRILVDGATFDHMGVSVDEGDQLVYLETEVLPADVLRHDPPTLDEARNLFTRLYVQGVMDLVDGDDEAPKAYEILGLSRQGLWALRKRLNMLGGEVDG